MAAIEDAPALARDLLGELAEIERTARETMERIAAGEARNGSSGLSKIHQAARFALLRAREAGEWPRV